MNGKGFAKGRFGHTGDELSLMASGNKPMALFYDIVEHEDEFNKYVDKGIFVKAEETFDLAIDPRTNKPLQIRCVLFALNSEEWRIDEMRIALTATYEFGAINDRGLEILKSMLLGYTADEIWEYHGSANAK